LVVVEAAVSMMMWRVLVGDSSSMVNVGLLGHGLHHLQCIASDERGVKEVLDGAVEAMVL
jgi:hypothetical protein